MWRKCIPGRGNIKCKGPEVDIISGQRRGKASQWGKQEGEKQALHTKS